MSMRFLLAAVPVLLLAAACGGGDGAVNLVKNADGLYVIERLDLAKGDLALADIVDPSVPNPYPKVVATVNGEEITGDDLVVMEISRELERRGILKLDDSSLQHALEYSTAIGPLDALVEFALMRQAVSRLGLLASEEAAIEYTRGMEITYLNSKEGAANLEGINFDAVVELLRLQGFPSEDWSSNDELVEQHRETLGLLALRQQECLASPTPSLASFIHFGLDCADFLAEERENADIEYFVVWAE